MVWRGVKAAALATSLLVFTSARKQSKQPNIVFIITDDQDVHMQSLDYMPLLQKHIRDAGTTFENHYCTVSICCPSRVNIWTGRAAHNTNVTDLKPPYGGYPKFVEEGLNDNWLPVWLQGLGYNTYYTGKLFNAHSVDNYNSPSVNGFNGSDFLLDPYTYEYYESKMSRDAAVPVSYSGQYSPDVVASKAYGFLDQAAQHERPFFLAVAPIAPHSNVRIENGLPIFDLPESAERHKHLFRDYKIPRTADFNPSHPSGVSWVKGLPKLNRTVVEYFDEFQRSRLRSLQAVDEMIEQIVQRLESQNLLENTYIFYTTDNGFHIGQHRMQPGKECPFETDIHIPLAVRGPRIKSGATADAVTSHTDLAATVLKLAGSDGIGFQLDGTPLPLFSGDRGQGEHVNVEFWGRAIAEGKFARLEIDSELDSRNNTYKALRVIGQGYSLLYTVWCTGEREYYDLNRDPFQMQNLLNSGYGFLAESYTLQNRSFKHLTARLDALLMVLKSCKAESCRKPWSVLHPDGDVESLRAALHDRFDVFYEQQPNIAFNSCVMGHVIDEEGPQDVHEWRGDGRNVMGFDEGQQILGSQLR